MSYNPGKTKTEDDIGGLYTGIRNNSNFRGNRGSRSRGYCSSTQNERSFSEERRGARGFRSSSRGRGSSLGGNQRIYPIGMKILEQLLVREPYIISLELLKKNSGYENLLNEPEIKDFKLCIIVKLLSKAVTTRTNADGTLDLLMLTLNNANFRNNLMNFISQIKYDSSKVSEILPLIGNVLEQFIKLTPVAAFSVVSPISDLCIGAIQQLKIDGNLAASNMQRFFDNIQKMLREGREKWEQSRKVRYEKTVDPPDNFRDLYVIPTSTEICSEEVPFLRKSIVQGKYNSCDHYLDVQFRLLKEDFMRPLRDGLKAYLSHNGSTHRNCDVRIYRNVIVDSTAVERTELVYYLKLDIRKNFRIENSKRLMFGNILCISADNFETMVTASVNNRDKLDKKLLGIKLETDPFMLEFGKKYSVIESKAYFVAYKHTLLALQGIDNLPLENYIVLVNETNAAPEYLEQTTTYKFDMSIQLEPSMKLCHVRLLDDIRYWPSSTEMGFDESQHRAIYGALTRQMAIIQGPPGTGKTFLGLHITKLLFHNKKEWSVGEKHPILVVCYTNHALDQFLEGITTITKNIVRVGSQSKNEALREFQISKRLYSFRRNYDDDAITRKYYQIRDEIAALKSRTDFVSSALNTLNEPGIIDYRSFADEGENPIPVHLRRTIERSGSMRHFLIQSFYKDSVVYAGNEFMQVSHAHKDESNEAKDDDEVDDDYVDEEESKRILDEDDDFNYAMPYTSHFHFKLETCPSWIDEEMEALHAQIMENPYSSKSRALQEKLLVLENERNVMMSGHFLKWNEEQCKQLENCQNVQDLFLMDRWKLYGYWKKKLCDRYRNRQKQLERAYVKCMKEMSTNKDMQYLNLMKKVDIVGMTTTGAAQYSKILHDLAPPIVIVEEAAEILEAHVISALSPKCKHLILIGDHQQLRPKPNVYTLGTKFGLDVSLFERMLKNGIQFETLEYQHRMKPCFSNLLVPTIYETLKDHPSVLTYPKIKGVEKDLFFISHTILENAPNDDEESFENIYEAEFLMALCRHLILQGYETDDIAIISPYTSQHRCLRKLQKQPEFFPCVGVRISILDNYQGEESNIILLSLVRSNEQKKIGFVKIENRICVALSRAKHGMYIIGNMDLMTQESTLWRKINQKLIDGENIGPALKLTCQNHLDEDIAVSSYSEFCLKSPDGGCRRRCGFPLPKCHHDCPRLCHVFDNNHANVKCMMPCTKIICKREHVCPDLCSEKCQPCMVKVNKLLACGHSHSVPCSTSRTNYKCPTRVNKTLPHCNHVLNLPCHVDEETCRCTEKCPTRLDCGHQCKQNCHALKDPDHEDYDCHEQCERKPEHCKENHKCFKKCFEDCGACVASINRRLACGHTMNQVQCGLPEDKIKCIFNCKRLLPCGHACPMKCCLPCGGCVVKIEKVVPECQHKVKISCSSTPTIKDCNGNCQKTLPCGHPCKKRCNDPCTVDCMELSDSASRCPKGHSVKIPCSRKSKIYASITELGEKTTGEYCTEVCGVTLGCGHKCKGKCGQCYNGRLHNTCKEPCKKVLVCGHVCKSPCSVDCPPCQEPCLLKCSHSVCRKKCGVLCINCKQNCERRCEHSKCTAKCGDPCNRKNCSEPCPLSLRNCGHPCIGFCGEPCPPLCRVCDYDEVTTIMFGNEDEPDARFVLLEDCKHIFEATGLETWLNSNTSATSGAVEIGMKKCPSCGVAIYNTKRFQREILQSYENVLKVKSKHYTLKGKYNRNQFKNDLKSLQFVWRNEIWALRDCLGFDINMMPKRKQKQIGDREYELYKFQLSFLKAAEATKQKLGIAQGRLKNLVLLVMRQSVTISSQMMDEISCELRRLEVSISVEKVRTQTSRPEIHSIIGKIDALMDPTIKFDKETERKVVAFLKEAERYMGGLGISDSERIEIVKAMQLSQGHWFKCPNGHIYAIGDCGGAVTEGTCPECKTKIGGTRYAITEGNRLAGEMDGATRSAWPGTGY